MDKKQIRNIYLIYNVSEEDKQTLYGIEENNKQTKLTKVLANE